MFFDLCAVFTRSTIWTSEDCRRADAPLDNEETATTMAALVQPPMAARRAEGQAATHPSDSSGWPEGAKEIRGGPEFRSCSFKEPIAA